MADLDRGVRAEFHPIAGLEFVCRELTVRPGMRRSDLLLAAEEAAGRLAQGQYAHLIFTGERDWDLELPMDEIRQMPEVIRVSDQTRPGFDFARLRAAHRGRFIGDYLDALAAEPDPEIARLAMQYGMEAIRYAAEE